MLGETRGSLIWRLSITVILIYRNAEEGEVKGNREREGEEVEEEIRIRSQYLRRVPSL
jgi:hypothetical protein